MGTDPLANRAVIWCAVSDKSQALEGKESLPSQKRDGVAACEREGLRVISVLEVDGYSRDYVDIRDCAEDLAAQGCMAMQHLYTMIRQNFFDVLVFRRGERFGRTQALLTWIVEYIVKVNNGRLYETSRKRWIDKTNFREYITTEGYRAASELENFVERTRMGMIGRMHKGLGSTIIPSSHRVIYDSATGDPLRLEVREELRSLWDDLATVLLERPAVRWALIEKVLYERYRHVNPATGLPWSPGRFYKMLQNPAVWGASAYGIDDLYGLWAFDETEPLPDGVELDRNPTIPIPPLYTGDQAEEIKAEIRLRSTKRGRAPIRAYKFSGLLRCGSCGRLLSVYHKGHKSRRIAWRCLDRFKPYPRGCATNELIEDVAAQAQIDAFLALWLKTPGAGQLPVSKTNPAAMAQRRIEQIEKELATLAKRINDLIEFQIQAEMNLRSAYTARLTQASERKAALLMEMQRLQASQESQSILQARRQAHAMLNEMKLENFWAQPPAEIRKVLGMITGKARFIVLGREIIDLR